MNNYVKNSKAYAYYSKNHKTYSYEITIPTEFIEHMDKKRKTRNLIRRLDEIAQEEYETEHIAGYCPKCGCLRAMNGTCPICD